MTKLIRRAAGIFLVILILFAIFPYSAVTAEDEPEYYGEAYLELKTEEQRTAYRLLEEGIAGLSPLITFEGIVEIKYGQIPDVLRAVCVDNPQYFWFLEEGKCNYSQVDYGNLSPVISFEPRYILDGKTVSSGSQELADAMYEFHTVVNQIINEIPVNIDTEYEIALYLHDYLAQRVSYTLEGEHPSAYAALVLGRAACYGYSKAYQCLLNAAGIRARTITGASPEENGKLIGHAWNQIWLDGKCAYVDVTWDDLEDATVHSYFACSLEEMNQDHFADKDFDLPSCGHDDMQVYSALSFPGVARWNDQTSAADAAASFYVEQMGQGKATFICEAEFTGTNFFSWFRGTSAAISDLLGISATADILYYEIGNVYHLEVIDGRYPATLPQILNIAFEEEEISLTGPGSCYWLRPTIHATSPWDPLLRYHSDNPGVVTVDEHGMITAVGEGEAIITASNTDGSVSASCVVRVSPASQHVHEMRYFNLAEPTCTQDGHEAYYLCAGCGCRFADETGAVQYSKTSDFIIPASHNKLIYKNLGQYHVQRCKCGEELAQTKQLHTDQDHDAVCDICNLPSNYADPVSPTAPNKDQLKNPERSIVVPIVLGALAIAATVTAALIIKRKIRGY